MKDVAGNALATNIFSSFTTVTATVSFACCRHSTTPSTVDSGDTQSVELGVKFTASSNGYITGIRYYKSTANTGTHTGSLWSSTGTTVGHRQRSRAKRPAAGNRFSSRPLSPSRPARHMWPAITRPSGHYSVNRSYFSSAVTSGPLQVPASGGVYLYGAGGFPTQSYQASNYWVDVVFSTAPPRRHHAPDCHVLQSWPTARRT